MEGPANELRAVQSLLWDHITSQLPSAEQAEVQRIVGSQLVEPNKALYKEATALADILGELRAQTDAGLQKRHRLCQHPQRELVEGELRMLISRLQDLRSPRVSRTDPPGSTSARKLSEDGSFTARSFSEGGQQATAGREWALRLYVASHVSQAVKGARPTTPRSPLSRPATASSRSMSRPSTALSAGSAGSGVDHQATLDAVRPSLNAMEADAIKERLREALAAEREALLEDVEYLQMCLEEETELHAQAQDAPPPLAELQTYSRKLQQELLEEEQRARHQAQVHRLLSGSLASPSSPPLGSSSSSPGETKPLGRQGSLRQPFASCSLTGYLNGTAASPTGQQNPLQLGSPEHALGQPHLDACRPHSPVLPPLHHRHLSSSETGNWTGSPSSLSVSPHKRSLSSNAADVSRAPNTSPALQHRWSLPRDAAAVEPAELDHYRSVGDRACGAQAAPELDDGAHDDFWSDCRLLSNSLAGPSGSPADVSSDNRLQSNVHRQWDSGQNSTAHQQREDLASPQDTGRQTAGAAPAMRLSRPEVLQPSTRSAEVSTGSADSAYAVVSLPGNAGMFRQQEQRRLGHPANSQPGLRPVQPRLDWQFPAGHASQAGSGGQRAETKLQNKTNVLSMTASGIAARKNGKVR